MNQLSEGTKSGCLLFFFFFFFWRGGGWKMAVGLSFTLSEDTANQLFAS